MTHPYFRLAVATLSLLSLADVHGQCHADLNGNHMVDNHDLLILLADYGQTCEDAGWHDPILSEIHYNPSTQQGSDSDHEFLELTNPHPFDLHVGGWSVADGMDCAFPPDTWIEAGSHLVVANNPGMLDTLVPDFTPVLGWSGASGLHNSGETLRLVRPDGSVAQTVTYSDTNGWPEDADGGGASLEWLGLPHNNPSRRHGAPVQPWEVHPDCPTAPGLIDVKPSPSSGHSQPQTKRRQTTTPHQRRRH